MLVLGQLDTGVPGQAAPQLRRELRQVRGDGGPDRFGFHTSRQGHNPHESAGPLDESGDR